MLESLVTYGVIYEDTLIYKKQTFYEYPSHLSSPYKWTIYTYNKYLTSRLTQKSDIPTISIKVAYFQAFQLTFIDYRHW